MRKKWPRKRCRVAIVPGPRHESIWSATTRLHGGIATCRSRANRDTPVLCRSVSSWTNDDRRRGRGGAGAIARVYGPADAADEARRRGRGPGPGRLADIGVSGTFAIVKSRPAPAPAAL